MAPDPIIQIGRERKELREKPTDSDDSSRCQASCSSGSDRRRPNRGNERTGCRSPGSENVWNIIHTTTYRSKWTISKLYLIRYLKYHNTPYQVFSFLKAHTDHSISSHGRKYSQSVILLDSVAESRNRLRIHLVPFTFYKKIALRTRGAQGYLSAFGGRDVSWPLAIYFI